MGFVFSCKEPHHSDAEKQDNIITNDQQLVYAKSQPIPFFKWSQDRDNLIQIYKMKNESRATYTVVRSAGTGEILWSCPSISFPIPGETQLTNPQQIKKVDGIHEIHPITIPQAEPNGLYTGNTDSTYVICVLKDGSLAPQYTEAKVDTFTIPVKVEEINGKKQVVFLDGDSSMKIEKHQ